MDSLVKPILFFDSASSASALVAGLPCAVRALDRIAGDDGPLAASLAVPSGWAQEARAAAALKVEITRLYPHADIELAAIDPDSNSAVIDGFACVALLEEPVQAVSLGDAQRAAESRNPSETRRHHARASRRIVRATGKPTDGFVSRYLNRPISQFVSYHLLKHRSIRPIHATIAAGMIGLAMALALFLGGELGLIVGALLFQLASIIDGVDGEIARATRRSSKTGATLDTATDAATNFAFLAGVIANLWLAGDGLSATFGLGAIGLLAIGLGILGAVSWKNTGTLSFDALKHDARTRASPVMSTLAKLLSRDVYILVLCVLVLVGLAGLAITLFAVVVALWFAAVIVMLLTRPRRG